MAITTAVTALLLAGCGGGHGTGGPTTSGEDAAGRPWPDRVAATGPWSATLTGEGDRMTFTSDGVVAGGLGRARLDIHSSDPRQVSTTASSADELPRVVNQALALPDGSRWYPSGPFRFEGEGDLPFSRPPGRDTHVTSVRAVGADLTVQVPDLDALLQSAHGPVAVSGRFVSSDGREVKRLALAPGTRIAADCVAANTGDRPVPCERDMDLTTLELQVAAAEGMTLTASGDGEGALAGSIRAEALGRTWEGLVGALEADDLTATAEFRGGGWKFRAEGPHARQLWVDVWPVIDTVLTARSVPVKPGIFDTKDLRIEWTNTGYATSQIYEAEGVGDGAPTVGFDLNKSLGHDAGLGIRRGDRVINLRGGGDIDSNLAPGESVSRRLSAAIGTQATIVLRGNFPEVEVPLAIPRT